jgi:hypothetical protein
MAYIVPQVLINQLISEVPLNTVKNQNVLVIGPNYELFRFAEEKEKTYIGEYVNRTGQEGGGEVVDESGKLYKELEDAVTAEAPFVGDNLKGNTVIPYPNQAGGTTPDAGYTKLFADEVIIKIASLTGPGGSVDPLPVFIDDDTETVGLDARLRFTYALTGPRKGHEVELLSVCDDELDSNDLCGPCDLGHRSWAISYTAKGEIVKLYRDVNPGDAIRIPYNPVLKDEITGEILVDEATGLPLTDETVLKPYVSTIVEVYEKVPGSGIFDCVQLADTFPEDFPLPTRYNKEIEPNRDVSKGGNPRSMAYYVYQLDTNGQDIQPAEGGDNGGNCDDSSESGAYESDAGTDVANVVQLCAYFSDVEVEKKTDVRHVWNWNTYENTEEGNDEDIYGVVVTGNLRVRYSNWIPSDRETGKSPEYRVLSAKLYVQHRDLIAATASDITSIASHTLVAQTLGTVHPDNPLAFGVYMAALNSGDRLVYYCGVPTDDLDGYNVVLGKASLTDEVYMICPTTMDLSVAQAVKAHCLEMSTAQNKLWRIGFVSVEPPAIDVIYDRTAKPSGDDFYAMFKWKTPGAGQSIVDVYKEGSNLIQFMKDYDIDDPMADTTTRCLSEVQVGDVVRIWLDNSDDDWDDTPHYTERYVAKIIYNNVLRLGKPVKACEGGACKPDMIPEGKEGNHFKVEVYRKLTPTQQVKYIADQSSQLATRRMYNVFPSIASNNGVQFDGSFLACAAAGLVSSVLPQQPVTNVAINGVNDIPIVYQTYTRDQLNTIAAGGTFIIMQDRPNAQVYVRHQISTDYTSGNLLKAELSITKNLDSISYYFAELFAPMIGKYNITPDLLDVLRNMLQTGLTALETNTAAGLYGPQVLAEGTEIVELRQSDVNRDHVYAKVHLNLPVPFNYFDLDLEI